MSVGLASGAAPGSLDMQAKWSRRFWHPIGRIELANFVVSSATVATQSLASTEAGFLTDDGSIVVARSAAVTMTGGAKLINNGELGSFGSVAVFLNAASGATLTQGSTGSIIGGGLSSAAIQGSYFGTLALRNAGEIIGGKGIALSAASGTQFNLGNSGLIEATGNTGSLKRVWFEWNRKSLPLACARTRFSMKMLP
jgi:hypothetical protein